MKFEDFYKKAIKKEFEWKGNPDLTASVAMLDYLVKKLEEQDKKIDFIIKNSGVGCIASQRLKELYEQLMI